MYRKFLIAGNWKMNNGVLDALALVDSIKRNVFEMHQVDVLICPPFISLFSVYQNLKNSLIKLGAQNMYPEAHGAFTGEISYSMLRDCGVSYVILGHSERRGILGETNEFINQKILAALNNNLKPILCVGETESEREAGKTFQVINEEITKCLATVSVEQAKDLTIAYEPIWAIGTGKTATPEIAQEVHSYIRGLLKEMFGEELADSIRILYGGSMKANNAEALLKQPDIDGGLIGGASLAAVEFSNIISIANKLA